MDIVGRETLYEQGGFKTERLWIRGWVSLPNEAVRYIWGLQGKETELTITTIRPFKIFEVSKEIARAH